MMIRLRCLGAGLVLMVALLTLLAPAGRATAGEAGLTLSLTLAAADGLNRFTTATIQCEQAMTHVERILAFTSPHLPAEPPADTPAAPPPAAGWPRGGAVEFRGLSVRGRPCRLQHHRTASV
jgi:hypothetical protein